VRKQALAFTFAAISALYACATAPALEAVSQQAPAAKAPSPADTALAQLMLHSFEVRSGNYDGAPKAVALMQAAAEASPNDTRLLVGLGTAYFLEANALLRPGGNPANGLTAIQNAQASYARALAIKADDPGALAGHGMASLILGGFMKKPEWIPQGLAEMNRAVTLAPEVTPIRLQRAFSAVAQAPSPERNATALEDLDFLSVKGQGLRSGDYVRVMRGDVYFETGQPDLARKEYEKVAASPRPGGEEARARLGALAGPGVARADIIKLRNATGSNCMMCHGS
jgi:hypothetical protein